MFPVVIVQYIPFVDIATAGAHCTVFLNINCQEINSFVTLFPLINLNEAILLKHANFN